MAAFIDPPHHQSFLSSTQMSDNKPNKTHHYSNLSSPDEPDGHYNDDEEDNESSAESEPMDFVYDVEDAWHKVQDLSDDDDDDDDDVPNREIAEQSDIELLSNRTCQLQRLHKVKSMEEVSSGFSSPAFTRSKSKSFDMLDDDDDDGQSSLTVTVELEHSPGHMTHGFEKLRQELATKDALISELQLQNKNLIMQAGTMSDGSVNEQLKTQTTLVSELMLECSKKNSEIDHLKAMEKSFKQTKQVLKDTTWTLKVREEELKNIKSDMRENYEKRLNELMTRLNEREMKLTVAQNENNILVETEKDAALRIQELLKQINLLRDEIDSKTTEIREYKESLEDLKHRVELSDKLDQSVECKQHVENSAENEWMREKEKLLLLLQEKDEKILSNNDQFQNQIFDLNNEISKGRRQIEELCTILEGRSTNSDLLPTTQVDMAAQAPVDHYLLKRTERDFDEDSFVDIDDLNSQCEDIVSKSEGDVSEGKASLQKQMSHTIDAYEGQIKELQSLYDQDIFLLEKENSDLKVQVQELKSLNDDVNNAKSMTSLNARDLKNSYEEKLMEMKSCYEDLLAEKQRVTNESGEKLIEENEQLRAEILDLEKKYTELFQNTQTKFEETFHQEMQGEVQTILGEQHQSMLLLNEQLHKELEEIKSHHTKELGSVVQMFNNENATKESLDDTYSSELLKLQEDKNNTEYDVLALKAELHSLQNEYNALKERYRAMKEKADVVLAEKDRCKQEVTILHEKCDLLSDENKALDADLSMRDMQLSKCKFDVIELNESVLELQAGLESENKMNVTPKESKKKIGEKSHALHEEILVLRANLDDTKNDVKNLLYERDKFESLSATLNGELKSLQLQLEQQSKMDVSVNKPIMTAMPDEYVEEIYIEPVYAEPVEAFMGESFVPDTDGYDYEDMTESMFLPEHESTTDYEICQSEICQKTNEFAKSLQIEVENLTEKIKLFEIESSKHDEVLQDLKEKLETKDQAGFQLQEVFSRQLLEVQNQNSELMKSIKQLEQEKADNLNEKDILVDSLENEKVLSSAVRGKNDALKRELDAMKIGLNDIKKKFDSKSQSYEEIEQLLQVEKESVKKLERELEDINKIKKELNEEKLCSCKIEEELDEERQRLSVMTKSVDELSKCVQEKNEHEEQLLTDNDNMQEALSRMTEEIKRKEENYKKEKEQFVTFLKNKDLEIQKSKLELKEKYSEFISLENRMKVEYEDTFRLSKDKMSLANAESLSALREDLERDHQSKIDLIQEQLHKEYGKEMENIRQEHHMKLMQLKMDHEFEIKSMKDKFENERKELLATLKETDEKIRASDVQAIQEDHAKELETLQLALDMMHNEEKDKIKTTEAENHAKKIEELKLLFEMTKSDIEESLKNKYEDILENELQTLKNYYESEIEKEKETHEVMLKDLDDQLKKSYEKRVSEEIANLKQEQEKYKDDYTRKMEEKIRDVSIESNESLESAVQKRLDELTVHHEKTIASYKEKILNNELKMQSKSDQIEELKKEINDLCEELETMKIFYEKQTLVKVSTIQNECDEQLDRNEKLHKEEVDKLMKLYVDSQDKMAEVCAEHEAEMADRNELHEANRSESRDDMNSELIKAKEEYENDVEKILSDVGWKMEQLEEDKNSALEAEKQIHELNLKKMNEEKLRDVADMHTQIVTHFAQKFLIEQFENEERLREIKEQLLLEQERHITEIECQYEQQISELQSKLEANQPAQEVADFDDENDVDSLEESIERIANDYVVLAINNSLDKINVEEHKQNVSQSLMSTPRRGKSKKVQKEPGSPVKEDVYNISCSYETYSEESVVVDVRDFMTQTDLIGEQIEDEIRRLCEEADTQHDEIERLNTELDNAHTTAVESTEKWKVKVSSLASEIQVISKGKLEKEEELKMFQTLHNEELSQLQQLIDFERRMKTAGEESLKNGVESAKAEMMKQHQNLLNEFAREQEREMDHLEHEHVQQLEEIKNEHLHDIAMFRNEVRKKLLEEFIHDPMRESKASHGDIRHDVGEHVAESDVGGIWKENLATDLKEVFDLLHNAQSKQFESIAEGVRAQIEKEHLDNLNEKCLKQKHVEQLEKLSDFQQQHVRELAELKTENDKRTQKLEENHEVQINLMKADIEKLIQQTEFHEKNMEDMTKNLEEAHQQEMSELEMKLRDSESKFESEEDMKSYISRMNNEALKTIQTQHDKEMEKLKDSLVHSNEAQMSRLESIIKANEPAENSDVKDMIMQLEAMKLMLKEPEVVHDSSSSRTDNPDKNHNEVLQELEAHKASMRDLQVENCELKTSQNKLRERLQEFEMHAESMLQRHDRQEDESSNLVKLLQAELINVTENRSQLKEHNILLSTSLTDMVTSVVKVEDMIHQKIDALITEHAEDKDATKNSIFTELELEGHESNERGKDMDISDYSLQLSTVELDETEQSNGEIATFVLKNSKALEEIPKRLKAVVRQLLQLLDVTTQELQENHSAYERLSAAHESSNEVAKKLEAEKVSLALQLASVESDFINIESLMPTLEQQNQELKTLHSNVLEKNEELSQDVVAKSEEIDDLYKQISNSSELCKQLELECRTFKSAVEEREKQIEDSKVQLNDEVEQKKYLMEEKKKKEIEVAELKTELENERYARKQDDIEIPRFITKTSFDADQENEKMKEDILALHQVIEEMTAQFEANRKKLLSEQESVALTSKTEAALRKKNNDLQKLQLETSKKNEQLSSEAKDKNEKIEELNEQITKLNEHYLQSEMECGELKEALTKFSAQIEEFKVNFDEELLKNERLLIEKNEREKNVARLESNIEKERNERNEEILILKQSAIDQLDVAQENEKLKEQIQELQQLNKELMTDVKEKQMNMKKVESELENEKRLRCEENLLLKDYSDEMALIIENNSELKDEVGTLQKDKKNLVSEIKDREKLFEGLESELARERKTRNEEILLLKHSSEDMLDAVQENENLKDEMRALREALKEMSEEKKDLYTQLVDSGFALTEGVPSFQSTIKDTASGEPWKESPHNNTKKQPQLYDENSLSDDATYTKVIEDEILRNEEVDMLASSPYHSLIDEQSETTLDHAHTSSECAPESGSSRDAVSADLTKRLKMLQEFLNRNSGKPLDDNEASLAEKVIQQLNHFLRSHNASGVTRTGRKYDDEKRDRMKMLLSDLQKEADDVLDLVLNDPGATGTINIDAVRKMQITWNEEKAHLMAVINSLKDIISALKRDRTGSKSPKSIRNQRKDLIDVVQELFDAEQNVLLADQYDIPTMDAESRVKTLVQKDRNLLLEEIQKLQASVDHWKLDNKMLLDLIEKLEQANEVSAKDVEAEVLRSDELLREKEQLDDRIADLIKLLNDEEIKVDEARTEIANEKQRSTELEKRMEVVEAEATHLQQTLHMEQKGLSELILEDRGIVSSLESMLQDEVQRNEDLKQRLKQEVGENRTNKDIMRSQEEKLDEAVLRQKRMSALLMNEREEQVSLKSLLVKGENIKATLKSELEEEHKQNATLKSDLAKVKEENSSLKSVLLAEREKFVKLKNVMSDRDKEVQAKLENAEEMMEVLRNNVDEKNSIHSQNEKDLHDQIRKLKAMNRALQGHLSGVKGVMSQSEKTMQNKIDTLENINKSLQNDVDEMEMDLIDGSDDPRVLQVDNMTRSPHNFVNVNIAVEIEEKNVAKNELSGDGQRLLNAGWTIAKVQRLYLKYFRAESFRKALAYQKRYLLLVLKENGKVDQFASSNPLNLSSQRKGRFKILAFAVVAINRMKYLVRKYQHNLRKSSPEYQFKDNRKKIHRSQKVDKSSSPSKPSNYTIQEKEEIRSRKPDVTREFPISPDSAAQKHLSVQTSLHLPLTSPKPLFYSTNSGDTQHSSYQSPPRSYPRPLHLHSDRTTEEEFLTNGKNSTRRNYSAVSRGTYTDRDIAAMSSDTNTSLNKYIDKLETLRLRLQKH